MELLEIELFDPLTVSKKMCLQIIYLIYMRKQDLALNNPKDWYAIKPSQTKTAFQAIAANLVSSTWRVSGNLGISQSNVGHHLCNLSKSIWSRQIVPHITKILQNLFSKIK